MLNLFFLFTDALLHHIWIENPTQRPNTFDELVEKIKFTPRVWNKESDIVYMLKMFSWTLNININYLRFSKTYSFCQKHKLYSLIYSFQNTLVKLLRKPHAFKDINLIFFQKKIYILNTQLTVPIVLTNLETPDRSFIITKPEILKLLKKEPIDFPFDVLIYSSYCFGMIEKQQKENNIIKIYKSQDTIVKDKVVIFITPNLTGHDFVVDIFKPLNADLPFNELNNLAQTRQTEGKTIHKKNPKIEKPNNQDFCVCDHETTQNIFPNTKYKSLGKNKN